MSVCGEGGEYETFTLDCPLFKKRIEMCVNWNTRYQHACIQIIHRYNIDACNTHVYIQQVINYTLHNKLLSIHYTTSY